MQLLLKGGRILDPSQGLDKVADLLVTDGRIEAIGQVEAKGAHVEDVTGKVVLPGLIDMHVHLRDPGLEHKEDIDTGTRAAAAGGFTAVACMPNTSPPIDNRSVVEYVLRRAQEIGVTRVYPIAALVKNLDSDQMAEIADMLEGGAAAFSDDAFPIANACIMRKVMEYCAMLDVPVILHCEDKDLSDDGFMNEGITSTRLGLRGIPRESEEISVARNIALARMTGSRLHIAHVSTAGSVEIIRRAKAEGAKLTCETCPQYWTLTDEAVMGYNTIAKTNPPLRTAEDVDAVKKGLADGTIDIIATDHAPHAIEEKETEFAVAPNGLTGLETAVGLVITGLVKPGVLSLEEAVTKMTQAPAQALKVEGGTLETGKPADITVLDLDATFVVDPASFYTKAKHSIFAGRELTGRPVLTVVDGQIVMRNGEVVV